MDSDEDDKDFDSAINMTGFMFGNIDKNGELEDDILDSEAKQHLGSLSQFGLSSLLQEMMRSETENEKANEVENNINGKEKEKEKNDQDQNDKDDDYLEKSPSALDFSDINELAEDNCEENTSTLFLLIILMFFISSYIIYILCPPPLIRKLIKLKI